MFKSFFGNCKLCPPNETKLIVSKKGYCKYHNEQSKNKKPKEVKSNYGNCKCCGKPGLIVVKAGWCKKCNEQKKKDEKSKRVVKLVNKAEKKKSLKQLKKELDDIFSLYIRQRNADKDGIVKCFTCGKIDHWKYMHCGHYISRRHTSVRWEGKNCDVQCPHCNLFNQGASDAFAIHLKKVYGDSILDQLEMKKNNKVNWGRFEYELLIKEYINKLNTIKQNEQQ